MKSHNNWAQSTLEYLVVLTAIVVVMLVAMNKIAAKDQNKGVGKLMNASAELIKNATERLPNY